jgi:hypothetical protein
MGHVMISEVVALHENLSSWEQEAQLEWTRLLAHPLGDIRLYDFLAVVAWERST